MRQTGRRPFTYAIKVNELITHTKRFTRTAALVKDFGLIADLLGPRFGCFLFQLPPSFHYAGAISVAFARFVVLRLKIAHEKAADFRARDEAGTPRLIIDTLHGEIVKATGV